MHRQSLSHVESHILLRDLATLAARDRATTAELLAHIAEVDARRLYADEAFPSMHEYCVCALRMSEPEAATRLRVARAAQSFPRLLDAIADGRLNLTTALMLVPHLTRENVDSLVSATTHKRKREVELILAERFPLPDVPSTLVSIATLAVSTTAPQLSATANPTEPLLRETTEPQTPEFVALSNGVSSRSTAVPLPTASKLSPLSPGRFALTCTLGQEAHDLLRYAQALLGHAVPSGDIPEVIERALRELVRRLEQQKFATGSRLQPAKRSKNPGHIARAVRREVWQRDGGQCTFVSPDGRRCSACTRLELDHIEPVARGGASTPSNLRLRCRAHNQLEAERVFGREFMQHKRETSKQVAEARRNRKGDVPKTPAESPGVPTTATSARTAATAPRGADEDVTPWLRALGFTAAEARQAAGRCAELEDAPLEQRVRVALASLAPPSARRTPTSVAACG